MLSLPGKSFTADFAAVFIYIHRQFFTHSIIGYARPVFFSVFIALLPPQLPILVIDFAYSIQLIIAVGVLSLQGRIRKVSFAYPLPLVMHISELGKKGSRWIIAFTDAFTQPVPVIVPERAA